MKLNEEQLHHILKKFPIKIREQFLDRIFNRSFQNEYWSHNDKVKLRQLNKFYGRTLNNLVTAAKLSNNPYSIVIPEQPVKKRIRLPWFRQQEIRQVRIVQVESLGDRFTNVKKLTISKDVNVQDLDMIRKFNLLQEVVFEEVDYVWDLVELICDNWEVRQRLQDCSIHFPIECIDDCEEIVALCELLGSNSKIIVNWKLTYASPFQPWFQDMLEVLASTRNCYLQLSGYCNVLPMEWLLTHKHKIYAIEQCVQSYSFQPVCALLTEFLQGNSALKTLTLRWRQISKAQFNSMSSELITLISKVENVRWISEDSSTVSLQRFPSVTHVEMKQDDDNICNMKNLLKLPTLRSLVFQFPEIGRQSRWQHLAIVGQLKQLNSLELYDREPARGQRPNPPLSEGELACLSNLTKLYKLVLDFDAINITNLSFISPLSSLDKLEINSIEGEGFLDQNKVAQNVRSLELKIIDCRQKFQREVPQFACHE
eukprot:TRINITY_DN11452_c0_g1_i2.p1 TRINITY_DN11452_c0_g1~~TRINITY_DN11452_c0_g1_i2.p1  ORF type:complete len:483 (+),score=6.70 TRINITY_DN11452_c0_g1_i2:203-1651(+)